MIRDGCYVFRDLFIFMLVIVDLVCFMLFFVFFFVMFFVVICFGVGGICFEFFLILWVWL